MGTASTSESDVVEGRGSGFRSPVPRPTVLEWGGECLRVYISTPRSRNALPITDTELRLIAAAAMMGLSKMPNTG